MIKFTTSLEKPEKIKADVLGFCLFDGKIEKNSSLDRIDRLLAGLISEALKDEKFKGNVGDIKILHTHYKIKSRYIAVVGLGEMKKFELETLRKATGKFYQTLDSLKLKNVVYTCLEACEDLCSIEEAAEAATEALVLASYRFHRYKSSNNQISTLSQAIFSIPARKQLETIKKGIFRAEITAEATLSARDLINTPAADKPPEFLGREAKKIKGIRSRVYHLAELKRMGMGGLVGVGQGSRNPPVLIEMVYRPSARPKKRIALIGKGVTFDSGGLSLKPAKSMETMKDDMSAAATVLAVMRTLKDLKPKVEVHAYVPSAENMPGGAAIRPGDVLKIYNGKTVEVLNTDAEGRLILADALSFAAKKKPDLMIDLATLTGACLVALGELYSAILSNNKELTDELLTLSKKTGERLWELPLVEEYKEEMKSAVADIQNIGGSYGGTINGGLFLQEFVGNIPWAHIDIAGPSWANKAQAYSPKGGTGVMVRTLCKFLMNV